MGVSRGLGEPWNRGLQLWCHSYQLEAHQAPASTPSAPHNMHPPVPLCPSSLTHPLTHPLAHPIHHSIVLLTSRLHSEMIILVFIVFRVRLKEKKHSHGIILYFSALLLNHAYFKLFLFCRKIQVNQNGICSYFVFLFIVRIMQEDIWNLLLMINYYKLHRAPD